MNRMKKIAVTVATLSVVAYGSAFAKSIVPLTSGTQVKVECSSANEMRGNKNRHNGMKKTGKKNFPNQGQMKKNNAGKQKNFQNYNEMIIGKIDSVDYENNKLVVINADSEKIEIIASPWTSVFSMERKEKEFSDIQKNKWVKVFAFNGETKTKNAARIVIEE